ncbi:MAG: DNA topoisomerase I [Nitrososphaerales archaeon]
MKGRRWTTLVHNGVAFPPEYEPKGVKVGLRGEWITLNPLAEEMFYNWAKKKDTPYVKDIVFQKNFLESLRAHLPPNYRDVTFNEIDLSEFYKLVDEEKKAKESLSKEEKKRLAQERKKKREELKAKYGYAIVDGITVEVSNWMVEPPGIFMGRGNHPLRGKWKERVKPEDVTLNLGEDAPIPEGRWGGVVHDHTSMWLAKWVDKIDPSKNKYVWLSESSFLRQRQDLLKYETAAKLEKKIARIRSEIKKMLSSKKKEVRKVATVCYLIDALALRVGDEKDEDEADTVGATTLRVEHVKINQDSIDFDFLGKDSVRWQKTLEKPDPQLIENFKEFTVGKTPQDLIFDGITSEKVNSFLKKFDKGLTAKVFRTYIATKTVKDFLEQRNGTLKDEDEYVKLYYAKLANLEAAIKCNHKRTPPKNWEESIRKKEERLAKLLSAPKPKTEKGLRRLEQRIRKVKLQLELAKAIKEYNLNTSLKNYIDPRVYYRWAKQIGLDWKLIYPKSMQRKFLWVESKTLLLRRREI